MVRLIVVASLVFSSVTASAADELVNPHAVDVICASTFGGPAASVIVYRDDGDVTALELVPDRERFAFPPSTLYAPSARPRLVMAHNAFDPKSPEAALLAEAHALARDGGEAAETIPCAVRRVRIRDLEHAGPGRYVIEGFVIHKFGCASCPRGGICQCAAPDHVAVSESRRSNAGLWPLRSDEVLALTRNLMPMLGSRYRMRVAVTDRPALTRHNIPDVEVLAMEPASR